MMESSNMESCVPPGFRFHPTDEELVGYYLRKKIASQKIDLDVIRDIDLYRIEPWDLIEICRIGYEEQKEWYFFSHKDKKYPTGTRTNRATMAGFWKATGRDKSVYHKMNKLIGMRKTLVFYKGRAPNGQKTDWIMHEYRLESDENAPPHEEGWVVCRAFKKRATAQTRSTGLGDWDPTYIYDKPSGINSLVNLPNYTNNFAQSLMCKQELELAADTSNNSVLHLSEQYLELPQLESPSFPIMKRPMSSISIVSDNTTSNEEEDHIVNNSIVNNTKVTTDWRELDKFVASQLMSQEERSFGGDEGLRFVENDDDDNDLHGLGLNGLLNSSRPESCDIGICIFDK